MPEKDIEDKKNNNSAAKIRANNHYTAKNYDEIKFRVPKGEKDKLKQYAQEHDYSLNAFIYDAVLRYRQFLDGAIKDKIYVENLLEPSPSEYTSYPSLCNPNGYKVVSLCSGMGSICLAFAQAGFDIIRAYEKDHAACETFRSLFGSERLVEGDFRNVKPDDIPCADVMTVGFPDIVFEDSLVGISNYENYYILLDRVLLAAEKARPGVFYLEIDAADPVGDDKAFLSSEEREIRNILEDIKEGLYREIEYKLSSLGYETRSYSYAADELSDLSQSGKKKYYIALRNDTSPILFIPPSKIDLRSKPAVEIIRTDQKQDDFYYYRNSVSFERFIINSVKSRHILYRIHTSKIYDCTDGLCPGLNAEMINKRNTVVLMDDYGVRQLTPNEYLMFKGYPVGIDFPNNLSMEDKYRLAGSSASIAVTNKFADGIKRYLDSISAT